MPIILCLANARKLAGRCVAGLRLDGAGWVRPVSKLHDGILNAAHVFMSNGKEAALLDAIEIGLKSPRPEFHQPENWLLDDSVWKPAASNVKDHAAILRPAIVPGPERYAASRIASPVPTCVRRRPTHPSRWSRRNGSIWFATSAPTASIKCVAASGWASKRIRAITIYR